MRQGRKAIGSAFQTAWLPKNIISAAFCLYEFRHMVMVHLKSLWYSSEFNSGKRVDKEVKIEILHSGGLKIQDVHNCFGNGKTSTQTDLV